MLKCEMCLGRSLRGEMSVLRSVDRSIEYEAGTAIEITDDTHRINVKVDGITVKLNSNGSLTVDIPDIYAVTAILETLSRYPLDHNYRDLRPLVPNGVNQGKWATETVGANNKHIYMDGGVIKASNANIGANNKPIYMNQGVLSASDASVGAANKPIHIENGVIKASGANVGTATKPMYMNTGVLTQCNDTLDVNISGNAPKDALSQKIDETYLKGIQIAADGTITVTRGDGQTTTYTTLEEFMEDVNQSISDLIDYTEEMAQNYVKRTPTDLQSNPTVFNKGSTSYNPVPAGSHFSNNTQYYNSARNAVYFDILSCSGRTYESGKTYYDYDDTIGDYVVVSVTQTNFLTNRDHLYIIYDSRTRQTFEEYVAAGQIDPANGLYTAIYTADSTTWNSTDYREISIIENEGQANEAIKGVRHSGILTATSAFDTLMQIYDMSMDLPNGKVLAIESARDIYGTGFNVASVMVIKGHKYKVTGCGMVSIGWFGD